MKVRYKQGLHGPEVIAKVYNKEEHNIDRNLIDKDAISVIEKLVCNGFESYLVGGAVRDLLLGNRPKDFDVVTSASPRKVHKLFYNSRIIGKRFKIVHVTFGSKIIEVSTFRSVNDHADSYSNEFGTIEEDATRRDFTINSLYYDPMNETIIDFNNAMDDFKAKRIISIIPLNYTFVEDPVRMIRAVKYHTTTGFRMKWNLIRSIKKYAPGISYISTSRMTEEINKILLSGHSSEIFRELDKFRLLPYMLPCMSVYSSTQELKNNLYKLDCEINKYKQKNRLENFDKGILYYYLTEPFIILSADAKKPADVFKDVFRQIKVLVSPNTPANADIEKSVVLYMKNHGIRYQCSCKEKKSVQPSKKHG